MNVDLIKKKYTAVRCFIRGFQPSRGNQRKLNVKSLQQIYFWTAEFQTLTKKLLIVPLSCPKMLFSLFPQFKVRQQCLRLVFPPKHWQEVTSDITDYPKLLKAICLKTKNTATPSKLHLPEDKAQFQQTKPAKQSPTTWPSTLILMGWERAPTNTPTSTTRRHNQQFLQPHCRTRYQQYSFLPRTVRDWNDLPQEVIEAKTIDTINCVIKGLQTAVIQNKPLFFSFFFFFFFFAGGGGEGGAALLTLHWVIKWQSTWWLRRSLQSKPGRLKKIPYPILQNILFIH